jgi:hypothetical protein
MSCLVNAVIPANQFTIAPSIQQQLVDKVTGLPLAFGKVYFWRDDDHTVPKPIYTISGPPDNPIFTELPNPLILSSIGTFIDPTNNQDIIPYYNPYDADGNIDLYFIQVYNSDGVFQFSRDHYPTVNQQGGNAITLTDNFLPDGQFLGHLNVANNGAIVQAITPIAYGNWTFELDSDFTSTNFVTFPRFDSPTNNPDANPRYACQIQCTVPMAAESRKDLCNTITDVNFMQGQIGVIQFSALSTIGAPVNVTLLVRQNFGTGGSPMVETVLANLVITPTSYAIYNVPFTMPVTVGQTLGPNDDDYLQIALRLDTGAAVNIAFTDMIFAAGTFTNLFYPPVSPEQDKSFWIPASFAIPAYDGSDSNKFVQLQTVTRHGVSELSFVYSDPVPPGTHIWYGGSGLPVGYLEENGSSYAVNAGGSVTAYIPLFQAISYNYGTGQNGFINASVNTTTMSHTYNRNDEVMPAPDAGTSGFTITVHTAGTIGTNQVVYVQTIAASAMTAGSYYRLLVNTTGPQFVQMFWFTIDGIGTIPSVTFDVAVEIPLLSSNTATDIATALINQANGLFQVPFLYGYFIRGWNNGSGHDPFPGIRLGSGFNHSGATGDNVGSFQAWAIAEHEHGGVASYNSSGGTGSVVGIANTGTGQTGLVINANVTLGDNYPSNLYFNPLIKY